MMETNEALRELRKTKSKNTFFAGILMVGFLAISAALIIVVVAWINDGRTYQVVIEEAQQTLKTTCKAAEGETLPVAARKDCEAAERGELPERLAREVDNPDPNDPENQDDEIQDPENQDPELQDSETQEPELPDGDPNDPDPADDPDANDDPDPNDPETQDEEIQDEEIQDPEIQDPEEQNLPVCPPGYTQRPFVWSGEDGLPNTGDERTWLVCMEDQ